MATPTQLLLLMQLQIKCHRGDIWFWQNYLIPLINLENVHMGVLLLGVTECCFRVFKDTCECVSILYVSVTPRTGGAHKSEATTKHIVQQYGSS